MTLGQRARLNEILDDLSSEEFALLESDLAQFCYMLRRRGIVGDLINAKRIADLLRESLS